MKMIENFEAEFLAFAKAKPADEVYDGGDITACALAQFAHSRGATYTGASGYEEGPHEWFTYPEGAFMAALPNANSVEAPRTWGALVTRLEALRHE
jgi:hypothetical protein